MEKLDHIQHTPNATRTPPSADLWQMYPRWQIKLFRRVLITQDKHDQIRYVSRFASKSEYLQVDDKTFQARSSGRKGGTAKEAIATFLDITMVSDEEADVVSVELNTLLQNLPMHMD